MPAHNRLVGLAQDHGAPSSTAIIAAGSPAAPPPDNNDVRLLIPGARRLRGFGWHGPKAGRRDRAEAAGRLAHEIPA